MFESMSLATSVCLTDLALFGVGVLLIAGKTLYWEKMKAAKKGENMRGHALVKGLVFGVAIAFISVAAIRTAIIRHPAALQSTFQLAQGRMQAIQEAEQREKFKNIQVPAANGVVLGNPAGSKTIIVFSDSLCPYCIQLMGELKKVVAQNHDVKIVERQFVVHGAPALYLSQLYLAAMVQGQDKAAKFYEAGMSMEFAGKFQQMFGTNPEKAKASALDLARSAGLDTKKLTADAASASVQAQIADTQMWAQKLGINGTPFVIVGKQTSPGALPAESILNMLNQ